MRLWAAIAFGCLASLAAGPSWADPCQTWTGGDRASLLRHAPTAVADRFRQDAAAYFGTAADAGDLQATLVSVTRAGATWYFVFDANAYAVMRHTLIYPEAAPDQGQLRDGDEVVRVCGLSAAEPR